MLSEERVLPPKRCKIDAGQQPGKMTNNPQKIMEHKDDGAPFAWEGVGRWTGRALASLDGSFDFLVVGWGQSRMGVSSYGSRRGITIAAVKARLDGETKHLQEWRGYHCGAKVRGRNGAPKVVEGKSLLRQ